MFIFEQNTIFTDFCFSSCHLQAFKAILLLWFWTATEDLAVLSHVCHPAHCKGTSLRPVCLQNKTVFKNKKILIRYYILYIIFNITTISQNCEVYQKGKTFDGKITLSIHFVPTSFQDIRNLDDKRESHLQISQIPCTTICDVLLELAIKDIAPFKSD